MPVLANLAISKLNTLVKASHGKCEIQLCKVMTVNKSCEKHFPKFWKEGVDLDEIATLGEDSPMALHGNSAAATTWKQVVQEPNGL